MHKQAWDFPYLLVFVGLTHGMWKVFYYALYIISVKGNEKRETFHANPV